MSGELLGVGEGVVHAPWLGRQHQTLARRPRDGQQQRPEEAPAPTEDAASLKAIRTRDARLLREEVERLKNQHIPYSQAVNLASINANTTNEVDITVTEADKVREGDYVTFVGAALNHGIFVQGSIPAPADDTIRLRVSNVTGAAIDVAETTFYFEIRHVEA